jgi:ribosomal-protein-alanine N-acetyltransferase
MNAPEFFHTARLLLRKPVLADAEAIFRRYSADPEVTRYLSWPTHQSIEYTRAFIAWSDSEWQRWPAGPFLAFALDDRPEPLLGSTGLSFQTPTRAITGYAFAQDAWGQGFATEALRGMVELAGHTGVQRLEAACHVDHKPSAHVLEKCGFQLETAGCEPFYFPNRAGGTRAAVLSYFLNLPNTLSR